MGWTTYQLVQDFFHKQYPMTLLVVNSCVFWKRLSNDSLADFFCCTETPCVSFVPGSWAAKHDENTQHFNIRKDQNVSHQFGDSSVVSPWKNCRNCAMNPQDFPPKILPKVWLVNWISPRERYEPGCCYFAGHSSLYPRRSEGHPGVRRSKNISGYFGSHLYMSHVWIL